MKGGERERERNGETYIQIDRQTYGQTNRLRNNYTNRERSIKREKKIKNLSSKDEKICEKKSSVFFLKQESIDDTRRMRQDLKG
jgi:hypothetical protein